MKEINLPSGNYLFVEVPDDAKHNLGISINNVAIGDSNNSANWVTFAIQLPKKDKFQIISTTKDITEEQAGSIVEVNFVTYKDYMGISYPRTDYTNENGFGTVKESLQSLIQANGLDVNKNYLILKKNG